MAKDTYLMKMKKIIEHLKNKTSTGTDGISNKLIKTAKNELVKPLTIIINQMLHTGIFPEPLKISKVVPLYKANDHKLQTYCIVAIFIKDF